MSKQLNGRRKPKAVQRALQEGEDTYHGNSSAGGTGREQPSPAPSAIGDIQPGHHLCCIYETEEEHRAVIVPFLRHGLEGGQKVLYLVDTRSVGTIMDYLREDGLDTEPYLERGQLSVLTAQELYLKDGVFDPDAMIALLRAETDQALAEGYAALRVTGEMSWALRGLPGSERLIEYETKLNRFFPGSKCLAICQYDRRAFSAPLLLDVLTTHPIAVIGTSVHDNVYYVPPGDLLGPDPQAARLRAWTKTLDERKEGSRVPVEPHASSALDESGEAEYFHSFQADTTERRRAEEVLRQSEANAKALLNAPFDSALLCEPDGTIVDLNEPAAKRMGATREELLGKNAFDSFPPELAEQRKAMGQSVITAGKPVRFEDERDGMCFDVSLYPVFDSQGNVVRMAIFAHDITERRRTEETLRQESGEREIRNRIADIFLTVPDEEMYGEVLTVILEAMASRYGVFGYLDDDRSFVVPSMTRDIWGDCQVPDKDIVFPRETWGDSTWPRAIREKRSVFSNEPSTNVPKGHIPIRRHISCPVIHQGEVVGLTQVANKETDYDENDMWLLETINAAIAPVLSARLDRDRQEKERRRAEEALGERIKELNCLFDMSKLIETPGISLEQVLQGTADLLPPSWQYPEVACARIVLEDQESKTENFRESPWRQVSDIRLSGERIGSVEVCYLEERPESDEGPFLKEEKGLIDAVAERLGRIVQRRRAEEAVRQSEDRSRSLLATIPDMMFVLRNDGTYVDFIPSEGQRPLLPPSEFLGRRVPEVMPIGLARRMMQHMEAALKSGEVQRLEYELEVDGETHNFESRLVAMAVDEILMIARDVTGEKRLEQEEARRSARDELEGKVERAMLGRNPYQLTFREFSVLHLVARGEADKEIADHLGISPFTVNKHVANILGKMNASSRTEASVRAHREGLIS